jgi:hypothetical protein
MSAHDNLVHPLINHMSGESCKSGNLNKIQFVTCKFKPFETIPHQDVDTKRLLDSLLWPMEELKINRSSRSRLVSLARQHGRDDVLAAMSKSDALEYRVDKLLEDISVIDISAATFILNNSDIECIDINSLTRIGRASASSASRLAAIILIIGHFNIRADRIIDAGIIETLDDQDIVSWLRDYCAAMTKK